MSNTMTTPPADGAAGLNTATRLAFERTRVAYERTMMAWVRTGTSLITFGFSFYKFFQFEMAGKDISGPLIGARGFALVLIGMGLLSLILGTFEHRRDLKAMRQEYPAMPPSMSAAVALLMGALGALALLAVISRA
jgi:putative membrane protein